MSDEVIKKPRHFIQQIIDGDLQSGKHDYIVTRFPPEPNGYLHIGHAKSIVLNFSLAEEYHGICHLRFDDTNPIKEEQEYVDAIMEDVRWLGYNWGDKLFHASDYFEQFYEFALELIQQGKAYVDSLDLESIRAYRGTLQTPGKESPDRNRPIAENLDLFQRMRAGEFPDGAYVLRAKIQMDSGNLNMRDPILYRIRHTKHQRTGSKWCIYPMYDFAHSLSDAIEGITHSLCTLEFQDHRPLYNWCVENVSTTSRPQQIEFARLNLSHTITSKRKLKYLVDEKFVDAWDDPRMPTLRGMRRRGYPAQALRRFCQQIGISKSDSVIDMSVLEDCVRDELNRTAPRAMAVLNPLKVVITNYPVDKEELLSAPLHPQDEAMGMREIPFSREIYIEKEDFMEDAPKKFFRLAPGKEVRLRASYIIRCEEVIKDDSGKIIELHCTYDPNTLGKNPEDRKVKGVIHWVSCKQNIKAQVRLYDRLFKVENPALYENFTTVINPNSLNILEECFLELGLIHAKPGQAFQFERLGYFCIDSHEHQNHIIFNRIVTLKNSWEKIS